MTRATNLDVDRAAEALTATMHDAGLPMGYEVIVGTTKGECLQRLMGHGPPHRGRTP